MKSLIYMTSQIEEAAGTWTISFQNVAYVSPCMFHSMDYDYSQCSFCSFPFRNMHIYKILNVYEE